MTEIIILAANFGMAVGFLIGKAVLGLFGVTI